MRPKRYPYSKSNWMKTETVYQCGNDFVLLAEYDKYVNSKTGEVKHVLVRRTK
ncbi:hypothetical protein K7G42_04070 [Streptococcus parauberis]|uniref:hypothetical protein n=1 Tax=Streptococcus parauberis TaxID=1348 RepID=UPI00178C6D41|nr:hypothetical protein [Streptococcus parauberis]WEM65809.1 hypothetical protein P1T45_04150 [Streptococcus parauberis]WOF47689.1 hypothetical protein K7G42_04070 [Streptococcus parauberis]